MTTLDEIRKRLEQERDRWAKEYGLAYTEGFDAAVEELWGAVVAFISFPGFVDDCSVGDPWIKKKDQALERLEKGEK